MADTKISAATAVVTPAATDEYPTNQGGASKKTTRAQMHALQSGEHLIIPTVNEPTTPTLAFGDGDTGFYEASDDLLRYSHAGVVNWGFAQGSMGGWNAYSVQINSGASTSTQPAFTFVSDNNTGVGRHSADNLSLIAGGLEGVRVEDPADLTAGETSLWLYDDDNNTVEQVTVGAADSGGAGYKVLRIPN